MIGNLAYRLSQSLAGSDSTAIYAWTRDVDGDLATTSDQEVFTVGWDGTSWSAPTQRTSDSIADRNVRVAVAASGQSYLLWQQGGDVVMDRDLAGTPVLVRADSQTLGFNDYAVTLGPRGNLLLIWQDGTDTGADAHYAVYDPASGLWSKDKQLFADTPLERSFSAVWDDVGSVTVAYNRVEITLTTKTVDPGDGQVIQVADVPSPGRVDLGVLKRRIVADLGFAPGGFSAEGASFLPGDQVALAAAVRNPGDLSIENVVVAFYDGNPDEGGTEIARRTISGWLDGAGETLVEADWTVPEPAGSRILYAVVDPDGLVSEIDEDNNGLSVVVGATDLAGMLLSQRTAANGSARLIVQVQNVGAPAPETTVALHNAVDSASLLASTPLPPLGAGARLTHRFLDISPRDAVRYG